MKQRPSFLFEYQKTYYSLRGQTKGKLGTPLARTVVDNVVGEQMGFYLQENSEMSQSLIRKAIKAREAREAAHKSS